MASRMKRYKVIMLKGIRILLFYLSCGFISVILISLITINVINGVQPIYYIRASKVLFPCILLLLPFLLVDLRK